MFYLFIFSHLKWGQTPRTRIRQQNKCKMNQDLLMMDLTCIVHIGNGQSCEGVKKLDKSKWKKLKSAVQRRKNFLTVTKQDSIVADFPEEHKEWHGYHSRCYKNFTAVPKSKKSNSSPTVSTVSSPHVTTRSSEASQIGSSTGVLLPICIFCNHVKSSDGESLGENETIDAETKIRQAARQINESALLSVIGNYLYDGGPDFGCLEVKYHHSCFENY